MTTTALALGWPVVRRHRWLLWSMAVAVAVAAVSLVAAREVLEPHGVRTASGLACLLLAPFVVVLAACISYGEDADVAAAGTCFPARQFTLPVRTAELAGWPVLAGAATVAVAWVAAAGLLLRPGGIDVALWWPALLAAAQLVWVQALLWRPFGLPWGRVVAGVLIGHVPATGVIVARNFGYSPESVAGFLGVAFAVGAIGAYAGVARSRRGVVPRWDRATRVGRAAVRRRGRAGFASAARAQDWFEWRRHGYVLPLLTAVLLPIFGLLGLFVDDHTPPKLIRAIGLALAVPVFFAGMSGTVVGKQNPWAKDAYGVPSFTATRPMTTAGLVAAILRAAARTTVIAWAVAAVMIGGAVYLSGAYQVLGNMWRAWLDARPAAEVAATVAAAVVVLLLLTWKRLVESLLVGLTGREWVIKGSVFAGVFIFFGLLLFSLWFLIHPEYHHYVPELLPWLLAVAVGLKLSAGTIAVRSLRRKRLVADRTLATLAGVWAAVYAVLSGLLDWVVPGEVAAPHVLAMGVVLVMPLARVAAMPLALDWNRHR